MVGEGYQPVNCFAGPDPPGTAVSLSWPTWLAVSSSPSSPWVGVQLPVSAQQVSIIWYPLWGQKQPRGGFCSGDVHRLKLKKITLETLVVGWVADQWQNVCLLCVMPGV